MSKQKLIETRLVKGQILEAEQGKLPDGVLCRVRYPICEIGTKNHNGRIYEMDVWNKVFEDADVQDKLKRRNLFGNQEHPEVSQLKLDKDATSHVVSNMFADGDKTIKADLDILPTDAGKFIYVLLKAGCDVGVSTRAEGELEEREDKDTGDKYMHVVPESYKFITVDFTADPSTLTSFPEDIKHNVVGAVKDGYESKMINRNMAVALLEAVNTDESKRIESSIKADRQHSFCKCKLENKKCGSGCKHASETKLFTAGAKVISEKKIGKIKHVFSRSNKYIVEFNDGSNIVSASGVVEIPSRDKAVDIVGNESKCVGCGCVWESTRLTEKNDDTVYVTCVECGGMYKYSEKKLKESQIPKTVVIEAYGYEAYKPNLTTPEARSIYGKILDYLLFADDPQYNRIVSFRQKIDRISDVKDKEELKKYFNSEFTSIQPGKYDTAWDYYSTYESVKESHLSTLISRVKHGLEMAGGDAKKAAREDMMFRQAVRNLGEYMDDFKGEYTPEEEKEASNLYVQYYRLVRESNIGDGLKVFHDNKDTGKDSYTVYKDGKFAGTFLTTKEVKKEFPEFNEDEDIVGGLYEEGTMMWEGNTVAELANEFEAWCNSKDIDVPTNEEFDEFARKYRLNQPERLALDNELKSRLKESMNEKKSLEDWRQTIEDQVPDVDVRPYSHNIISLALGAIAKEYGKAEANKAIDDFGLAELGWSKVEEASIDSKIESEQGKAILADIKKFIANKGNSHEQPALYKGLMNSLDSLHTDEALALEKYLKKHAYSDLSKQNESINETNWKNAIEEYEYYKNGFNRLSGHDVKVKNVRIKGDEITADVTLNDIEGGKSESFRNVKYTKNVLNKYLGESAPPGGEYIVKALKGKKNVNPYALAWSMRKKGDVFRKGKHKGEKMSSVKESIAVFDFDEMLKEMQKIEIVDALPGKKKLALMESKTSVELVQSMLRMIRESINDASIANAESEKLIDMYEQRISSLEENYVKDVKSYNERINEMNKKIEESNKLISQLKDKASAFEASDPVKMKTISEQADKIKQLEESHIKEMSALKESHVNELKKKLTDAVNETIERTSTVAKRNIDEITKKYETQLSSLKESHAKEMKKYIIEAKLRDANLLNKIPANAYTLLEQAKDSEVDGLIREFKYAIKEGMFHSISESINVPMETEKAAEDSKLLDQTQRAVEFLNR